MAQIRVLVKRPGEEPSVQLVENDWKTFKTLIDDGLLEAVSVGAGIMMYLDDVGKFKDLPFNFRLGDFDCVAGPAVFFGCAGTEYEQSLTDDQIEYLQLCLAKESLPVWSFQANLKEIIKIIKRR